MLDKPIASKDQVRQVFEEKLTSEGIDFSSLEFGINPMNHSLFEAYIVVRGQEALAQAFIPVGEFDFEKSVVAPIVRRFVKLFPAANA